MGLGTQVIHLQFGLLLVGLAFAIRDLLASRVRPLVLWPMLLVVLLLPAVAVQAGSAQADIPLGVFVALATVCAWVWLREADRTALALLGLFSAAALATKLDATVYLGALFLVLVILVGRRSLRRAGATVAVGAAALVGIVPWRIWVAVHDVPGYYSAKNVSSTFLTDEWRRVPLALEALLEQALAPGNWLFAVPLALLAAGLAVLARRDADGLLLVGAVLLSLAGLVFVYWVTPLDFFFHLGTSTSRVVVPLVLACAALAPALIGEALEQRPRPAMRA
jgi:4-amino-4-deoxy-L-arabinose transferase-like glycosyltransferase